MENRGTLYVGLLFIVAGLYFLLVNLAAPFLRLGWAQLWPGFLLLAAVAFFLPIVVWWERRRELAGLAVPGTILLVNALIFLYNSLTNDWDAWAYLWSLEPLAVGLGVFGLWLVGPRHRGILAGAGVLGAMGLILFALFGSVFGADVARALAPIVLIALGLLLLLQGLLGGSRRRTAANS